VLRFYAPTLDVLAAQEWFEQLGRFLISLDQPVTRFLVDNECLIEPGLDTIERRTVNFPKRLLAPNDLVT